jgi:hypothetical protein
VPALMDWVGESASSAAWRMSFLTALWRPSSESGEGEEALRLPRDDVPGRRRSSTSAEAVSQMHPNITAPLAYPEGSP